jgi:putative hydrolase of the HAD superfamily
MIKGVIFDFDNTLYDYDICNKKSLEKVFNYINTNFSIDLDTISNNYNNLNKMVKQSNSYSTKFNKSIYFKKLLEILNLKISILDIILDIYESEFLSNLKLFDGLEYFIDLLKENNIKVIIASNNIFIQQYKKIIELKLENKVDLIITSDEIGNEKPSEHFYTYLINKIGINPENLVMIGDNISHDIEPSIKYGITSFHFKNDNSEVKIKDKYFEFGSFNQLFTYISDYFNAEKELIYLSKYFGQSVLNIQGQGGNISIKSNDLLLIKSSGCILGNMDLLNGFCSVNNSMCKNYLENNIGNLKECKMFGYKIPSMETYFHSFMKKYTVHIHFTLSNIFSCSNVNFDNIVKDLGIPYKIIDYYEPGLILAKEILSLYSEDIDVYFLKNHGLIITNNNWKNIFSIYKKIFNYFDNLLSTTYKNELMSFEITEKIYKKFDNSIVCRLYNNLNYNKLVNIKYCFPDLAVYIQKILIFESIDEMENIDYIPEIIIINTCIYVIAENLTKLYCIIETLDLYKEICTYNYDNLILIKEKQIQNMEQEKYRKNA